MTTSRRCGDDALPPRARARIWDAVGAGALPPALTPRRNVRPLVMRLTPALPRPPRGAPPQIAADLPAQLEATPASVLATLRFLGISAKPPPGKRRAPKPARRRGGGGEGRAR
jgi:hypothetical protein